jgi:phosphate uptake regulator
VFRQLLAAWRKTDPLKEMYRSLISMIEAGEWMFEASWAAARDASVPPEFKAEVYRRDIEVNRTERSIRRRIVEHLSVEPGVDVPACLVLMSVVKDAERIGDYCKNILEAAELEAEPVKGCEFFYRFDEAYKDICGIFRKTRRALAESDETLGQEVIVEERNISARCDALVERIAKSDLPARLAVPWALLARYLKRVSAHLGNLASSLVMPLHKLDYYDEKCLRKEPGCEDAD